MVDTNKEVEEWCKKYSKRHCQDCRFINDPCGSAPTREPGFSKYVKYMNKTIKRLTKDEHGARLNDDNNVDVRKKRRIQPGGRKKQMLELATRPRRKAKRR